MVPAESGIWVCLFLDEGERVEGFAAGAESPNDFWVKFRTQFVRVDRVRLHGSSGAVSEFPSVYVNRDRIRMARVVAKPE